MAQAALRELDVSVPCLVGLAKAEEVLVRADGAEIALGKRHPGLKLLMSVRDEAHRFCRRYLHQLQRKEVRVVDISPACGDSLRMLRSLVVDPSPFSRPLIKSTLVNCHVSWASTGGRGLDKVAAALLQQQPMDFILLDSFSASAESSTVYC